MAPPSASPRPRCSVTPRRRASCPTPASWCCAPRTAAGRSSTGTVPCPSPVTSPPAARLLDRGSVSASSQQVVAMVFRATDRGWMLSSTVDAPTRRTAARLDWVDAAKGMSILLVVGHHIVWFLERSGQAPGAVVSANEALASLRMPLFFLASGLLAAGPLAAQWRGGVRKRGAFFLFLYAI